MLKRTCVQCGKEFEMSQSEINFYKKKKLSLPKRCKECREENKNKKKNNQKLQEEDQRAEQKIDKKKSKAKNDKTEYQTGKTSDTVKPAGNNSTSNQKEKKMSAGKKRLVYIVTAAVLALGGGGTAISTLSDAPAQDTAIEQTIELEDTTLAIETEAAQEEQIAGEDSNTDTVYVETTEKEDESEELTEVVIEYKFRNDTLFEDHYKKHGIEMGFASKQEYLEGANRVIASPDVLHKKEAEDGDDVYYLEETNEFVVVSKAGYIRTYFNPSDGINYYNRQ